MLLSNMTGLTAFGVLIVAMVLIVPWERIRRLALFTFLFGVLFPFAVIGVMQNLLGLWSYRAVDPVTIADIPVFLAVAWAPALVLFAHFMVQYRSRALRLLLLLTAGAGVAGMQYFHLINGNLVFQNWTLFGSFLLGVGLHILMLMVLQLMGYLKVQDLLEG